MMNDEKIKENLEESSLDYCAFQQMVVEKFESGELSSDTLTSLIDQIYMIGRFTGRLEQQLYQDKEERHGTKQVV